MNRAEQSCLPSTRYCQACIFAVDNVDFAEHMYNGQHTLHGTAMEIYQKKELRDDQPELR